MNQYKNPELDSFETNKIKEMENNLSKYREGRKNVIDLALNNKNIEAYKYYEKNINTYTEAFLNNLVELGNHNNKIAEQIHNKDKANFKIDVTIFLMIVVISSIIIILLGIVITKHITKRLNDFVLLIGTLAKRDFSLKINKENLKDKSEFGIVTNALDKMTENIISLINELTNTSDQLILSSEELTSSAEQSADASNLVATAVTNMASL